MILQALVQYYETLEKEGKVARSGWCDAKVSFALELSLDGRLCRVIPLKIEKQRGKKTVMEPKKLRVPQMVTRSSGMASNFLCDNSSYILGIDNKGKPERAKKCFLCAKEKHQEILKDIDSPEANAILQYFESWDCEKALVNPLLSEFLEEIMAGANLVFWVCDDYAQKSKEIKEAWEKYCNNSQSGSKGVCLVTGERTEISRIHGNIKGVRGAQSSGASLVSFNANAFESYGKEQSFNAPVGTYAVYAYTTALNYLVSNGAHTANIGDTTVVYWSEDGNEACQNIFQNVSEPTVDNEEIIDGVFKNLEAGKAINVPDVTKSISLDQRFYILGLAPNAARLAVRFFYQDSFGNILRHMKEHYDRMEIVKPVWDTVRYMGVWQMLMETANKKSKDKKPVSNMAGSVYRAVISGERYPDSLYYTVLGRIRAEQDDDGRGIHKITRGRAAIIKAFLIRNRAFKKEDITMGLNENSKNVIYTLGREFAVLEAIQLEANPGINATIKDRYFNSACATPASIFPVLFKLKNSHIRKITNKGTEIYYEKLLGNLQEKIFVSDEEMQAYPKRLSLEEQGMFILGYYHQTQKRYEKKEKEEN